GTVTVNAGGQITGGTLGGTGTLTVGGLTFSGGTYAADFSGNASDTITTSGPINLNSGGQGVFSVNSAAGTPSAGNAFTLINTTAAGAIANPPLSGTAEGGTVTVGTATFRIFYNGGDGNDVVLVNAAPPTTVYVDDDFASLNPGQFIVDADPVAPGNQ